MFVMTSDIVVGKYRVKPNSVKWKVSVLSAQDTCTITLPRIQYLSANITHTDDLKLEQETHRGTFVFNEGDAVSVALGYDNTHTLRFKGFVKNIGITEQLVLECVGYSYQLPKSFSKSYQSVTLKDLLRDLLQDTDIQISKNCADVQIKNPRFKNATGWQVLEYIQKELHLTPYFLFDTLYVGTRFGNMENEGNPIKLQLGWNTVDDKDFKKRKTDKNVLIKLVDKNSAGTVKKTKSDEKKYSQEKEVKIKSGLDEKMLKQIANDLQTKENYQGYEGTITAFLVPEMQKSEVVQIIDKRYPEREGLFFIEAIDGSFDSSGGRQKVTLNYYYDGK